MEQKGLTKAEVSFIEDNFLQIVAKNLDEEKIIPNHIVNVERPVHEYNYMYA